MEEVATQATRATRSGVHPAAVILARVATKISLILAGTKRCSFAERDEEFFACLFLIGGGLGHLAAADLGVELALFGLGFVDELAGGEGGGWE